MVFTRNIIFEGSVIEDKKMGSCFTPAPRSPVIAKFPKLNGGDYVASWIVQPKGMPEVPFDQDFAGFFTKVPEEATSVTHPPVALVAEVFVAKHLI